MATASKNGLVFTSRNFHCSSVFMFAKSKDKKIVKASEGISEQAVELPDVKALELKIEKKISRMVDELSKLRGGKPSNDMFNHLYVEAYGSKIPFAEAGQISIQASKLTVSVFDGELVAKVSDSIRGCGLSLNPNVEGNKVIVSIPKPSHEARENIVKLAGKVSEKAKQDVRQVRKDGLDSVKKLKSQVSEDDARRVTKEIDALADKAIDKVAKLLKDKEKEILSS